MAKPRKNKQPQADGLTREGLVIKNTGSWYDVLTNPADDADSLSSARETIPCKVKGNFRLKGIRTTNPVAVGDRAVSYTHLTLPTNSLV